MIKLYGVLMVFVVAIVCIAMIFVFEAISYQFWKMRMRDRKNNSSGDSSNED